MRVHAITEAESDAPGSVLRSGVTPWNLWRIAVVAMALILSVPVLTVIGFILQPTGEVWQHLRETVLKDYVVNSLVLSIGVGLGTFILGVITAWLTSLCDFPGRKIFTWALLLPMAMPAYIIAYTYTGMFDVAGPVQTILRAWFGWRYGDYWFPEIRSMGGAISLLSLVLFPYVYLLTRSAFIGQSVCVLEVSRTLGCGPWRSFYSVAMPLARPAIVAGVSLAMMEALADYGTVKYFGISTFTTGIFRTWFGLGDTAAAAQLAALMLAVVLVFLVIERWSRRRARYHHTTRRYSRLPRYQLHGIGAGLALATCFLPLALGFLLPALQLIQWAVRTASTSLDASFGLLVWHSLSLATAAAIVALLIALLLAYGKRLCPDTLVTGAVRCAAMGYAVPGTVIAVGVMIPFAWLDNSVDAWWREHFNDSIGLLLSGTLVALLFAYLVRFLTISLQAVENGLGKIGPSMDDAARSLGERPLSILRRVHLPIIRGSVLTALLLVFVDVLKELPATLILRPFNFNTLAVRAFELASDERLMDSSTSALAIVVVGIIPVMLLSRSIAHSRPGDSG